MKKFIIRWRGYALRFGLVPGRRVYSAVSTPADATTFTTAEAAWQTAQEHNLRWSDISIDPIKS